MGLYTVIEVVDDTVVKRHFGSDDGNIHEGEESAASFVASACNQIAVSFQKESNEDQGDWSDIEALFDVLHTDQRTSDPAAWRADLEAVKAAGEKLHIKVLGLATIAPDVTPSLALATIESITVLGALHASKEMKSALADRIG